MKEHVKMFENFEGGHGLGEVAGRLLYLIANYVKHWRRDGFARRPLYWPMETDPLDLFEIDVPSKPFFGDADMGWNVQVPPSIMKTLDDLYDGLMDLDAEKIHEASLDQVNELMSIDENMPRELHDRLHPNHYEVLANLIAKFHEKALDYVNERVYKEDRPQRPQQPQSQQQAQLSIDDILDKINNSGIQSLTKAQRDRLDAQSGKNS